MERLNPRSVVEELGKKAMRGLRRHVFTQLCWINATPPSGITGL